MEYGQTCCIGEVCGVRCGDVRECARYIENYY